MLRRIFAIVLVFSVITTTACAEIITIDELNISFTVPEWIEWATRTEGNYDIMEMTYHMDRNALISYMETGDEYFKGVDPNSSLRILMGSYPAYYTDKNFSAHTDAELCEMGQWLLAEMGAPDGTFSIYTSVSGNRFLTIQYILADQTICFCITCINGNFYFFNVRGEDGDVNSLMLSYLMETLIVEDSSLTAQQTTQTATVGKITFSIAGNWIEEEISIDPSIESVCFKRRGSDGLGRYITCNVIDLCTQLGYNDAWRRILTGDQYSKQLAIPYCSQLEVDVDAIEKYTFGNNTYYGFACYENGVPAIRMFHVHNGYLYVYIFESYCEGDLFMDECYPEFEAILSSVEY